jgi:6-phosphogluconolactonase
MADAVASDVEFIIDSALDARGEAIVAFPGGKTPGPVFERLAAAKLNWKRVTIIPTDDRLVAPTSPLSNVGTIARRSTAWPSPGSPVTTLAQRWMP